LTLATLLVVGCSGSESNANADAGSSDVALADVGMADVAEDFAMPDMPTPDLSDPDMSQADADATPMLMDEDLLLALRFDAQETMSALGYNTARDRMYALGGIEDVAGRIEGVYTGRTVDTDNTRVPSANCQLADGTPTNCAFNTEHTVPRGRLREAFGEPSPEYDDAEGDLHHLFPSDETANNLRASFDFGATDCATPGNCRFDEESQLGLPTGMSGDPNCPQGVDPGEALCVMQVRPARRGDIARAMFYMSMRWELPLDDVMETSLRGWHVEDPPDQREDTRNAAVESSQGNRNPFIDDPTLVDRISDF
jgi:hypothetical protein